MRSRHSKFLSLLATVVIAAPSPVFGRTSPRQRAEGEPLPARALDASGVPAPWPCRVLVTEELWQFAELAWERSGTFRAQCGKLAAAGAVVVVQAALPDQDERAAASIGVAPEGVRVARIRVRPGRHAVELIAHELEHVTGADRGRKSSDGHSTRSVSAAARWRIRDAPRHRGWTTRRRRGPSNEPSRTTGPKKQRPGGFCQAVIWARAGPGRSGLPPR